MKTYTLITGASSGIGKALSIEAARDGHNLIVTARNMASLQELADSLDVEVVVITADLAQAGAATKIYEEITKQGLVVDNLINNAGTADQAAFENSDLTRQLQMMQLNMNSLVELTHLLLPSLISRNGSLMNVASAAAFLSGPYMSVYYATKAFVLSFSEGLHEELRGRVSVTALCPGPTKTQLGTAGHVTSNHPIATTSVTADSVANYGYRAMKQGKAVAVHGITNKIIAVLPRFVPRSFVRRAVARAQRVS